MWAIKGKYRGCPEETIDSFVTEDEANRMLAEYRIAFGHGWILYVDWQRGSEIFPV